MDKNNSRTLNENSRINEEKQRIRNIYCRIKVPTMTGQSSNHLKLVGNGVTGELLLPPITALLLLLASLLLLLLCRTDGEERETEGVEEEAAGGEQEA